MDIEEEATRVLGSGITFSLVSTWVCDKKWWMAKSDGGQAEVTEAACTGDSLATRGTMACCQ